MKQCFKGLIALLLFAGLTHEAAAQTDSVYIANASWVAGPKYQFDVYVFAGSAGQKMGSSNIAFTYSTTGFGTNATATFTPANYSGGSYDVITFTDLFSNEKSININYNGTTGNGTSISNVLPGTLVGTVQMNIVSASQTSNLQLDAGNSPIFLDDQSTLVTTLVGPNVNGTLPVEMTNCSASANRLNATISWTTATETNNFGFDIERKPAGNQLMAVSDWTKVGFVQGKGTSAKPTTYSFVDEGVTAGTYAYRVKQIDKSGSFTYSSEMTVNVGAAARAFTLSDNYPNPFNPTTNIEFTLPNDGHVTLKVYNVIGQEVATLFDGEAQAGKYIESKFDATRLSSGVYFARLQYGGKALLKKMLLLK